MLFRVFLVPSLIGLDDVPVGVEELHLEVVGIFREVIEHLHASVDAAHRVDGIEQVQLRAGDLFVELTQRRHVEHHPERAAVCRDHQVVVLYDEIGHLYSRQVEREGLPIGTVIPRHVHRALRRRIQNTRRLWILAHGTDEVILRNAVHDFGPRLSVIFRLPDVGAPIVVDQVTDARNVRLTRRIGRRFDGVDANEVRRIARRHVVPTGPTVPRHVHEPVVGSHPNHVGIVIRRRYGKDSGVRFDAGLVLGERPTRRAYRRRIGAGQVRTDLLPGRTLVGGLPNLLRSCVEDIGSEVREHDGEGPLHALDEIFRRLTHRILRPHIHLPQFAVRVIVAAEAAAVTPGEEDVGIHGAVGHVSTLAAAHGEQESR